MSNTNWSGAIIKAVIPAFVFIALFATGVFTGGFLSGMPWYAWLGVAVVIIWLLSK